MVLAEDIDSLVRKILLKAENQHELLLGSCQSELKLTNTQEHILMLLAREGLTNRDLAQRLHLSQAAVTKAVKSLVKQGLLATSKDSQDARQTQLQLTDLALPIAQEHEDHHEATLTAYQRVLADFDGAEKQVIAAFLRRLAKELGD